jgi:drug/metabolite transporter (DMT)-like permease
MFKRLNPYFEAILSAIIWSTSGIFIKYLNLPSFITSFFRLAVPALFLLIFFRIYKIKINFKDKIMFLASLLNAVRIFFYFVGFSLTSIGNVSIMLCTWPIFATIFGKLFLKEKLSKRNFSLIIATFLGIILVYSDKQISFEGNDFLGMSSIVFSSLLYSLTVIIYKKKSKIYTPLETVFYQNIIGAIVFMPFIFVYSNSISGTQFFVLVCFGLLIGVVGFGLFFSALGKIKTSIVSTLSYTKVFSGVLFGILLFNEVLTWGSIIGGVIIVVSTIFIRK